MKYILLFLSSFLMSIIITPIMIRIALKFNIFDRPDNILKDHKKPVPYLGGASLFISFIVPLLLWKLLTQDFSIRGIAAISIGSSLIFLTGLIDDLKKLSIHTKFFVQIVVAVILVLCNIRIEFIKPEFLGILITILWIVGVTNSFNIIDIMDGLAAGVAFIASIAFFLISVIGLKIYSPMIAICLAGSTLGFLIYNFNPANYFSKADTSAKIFMGDAGSLFLGFTLASLAITESYSEFNSLAVLSPLLILSVPVFETLFVMFIRFKKGISMFYGSPDHFPIRLTRLGWSRKKVVLFIYIISIILCILVIITTQVSILYSFIIYSAIIIFIIFFVRFLITRTEK